MLGAKVPCDGGIKCRNPRYARVSTRDQDLAAQDAELMAAGCAKVFKEKVSGAKTDRPELAKVIAGLSPETCSWSPALTDSGPLDP
jgi:resolvase-like protein